MAISINDFKEGGRLRQFVTQTGLLDQVDKGIEDSALYSRLMNSVTHTDVVEDPEHNNWQYDEELDNSEVFNDDKIVLDAGDSEEDSNEEGTKSGSEKKDDDSGIQKGDSHEPEVEDPKEEEPEDGKVENSKKDEDPKEEDPEVEEPEDEEEFPEVDNEKEGE